MSLFVSKYVERICRYGSFLVNVLKVGIPHLNTL
jgi:hypothetical protein